FTYTATDNNGAVSAPETVTITVHGKNNAAQIAGDLSKTVDETNEVITLTGTLTSTDIDGENNRFEPIAEQSGKHGTFSLTADGAWTFVANSAFNELNVGQHVTESFDVTSADGTKSAVTVTITGTNDRPVISFEAGNDAGIVTEDDVTTVSGTLSAADVDNNATLTWSIQEPTGQYGKLTLDGNTGTWTYALDNTSAAVQALAEGETHSERFTIIVTDEHGVSAEQIVNLTVVGRDDGAQIAGDLSKTVDETD